MRTSFLSNLTYFLLGFGLIGLARYGFSRPNHVGAKNPTEFQTENLLWVLDGNNWVIVAFLAGLFGMLVNEGGEWVSSIFRQRK